MPLCSPFDWTSCTWGLCTWPPTRTSGRPTGKGPACMSSVLGALCLFSWKSCKDDHKGIPLGLVPVFSGELQMLGEKSSVTAVILETCFFGLNPVGTFFLLLLAVCPARGAFLTLTATCPLGSLLRVPPFSIGVFSQETVPSCD